MGAPFRRRRRARTLAKPGSARLNDLLDALGDRVARPESVAAFLWAAARKSETSDPDWSLRLAELALGMHHDPRRAIWAANRMVRRGRISAAMEVLENVDRAEVEARTPRSVKQAAFAAWLHDELPALTERCRPGRMTDRSHGTPRVGYALASHIGYQNTGYTIRSHELAKAIKGLGTDIVCLTRDGFPFDRHDGEFDVSNVEPVTEIDGVTYKLGEHIELEYGAEPRILERFVSSFVARIRAERVTLVQAASNHRNALPALLAARRLGLPFVYEVRGLWHLSQTRGDDSLIESERYEIQDALETFVCAMADRVLVISEQVKDYLVGTGLAEDRLVVVPNGVDTERYHPHAKDHSLSLAYGVNDDRFTLVYAGAIVDYEGIDDLVAAIALLPAPQRQRVQLLVFGEGKATDALARQVTELALEGNVFLRQRVDNRLMPEIWNLADAVVLPRKDWEVARRVPPIKPLEVMALARPLVMSDLPVNYEFLTDRETGLLSPPQHPEGLAQRIVELMDDEALRLRLGDAAREWVTARRDWRVLAARMVEVHQALRSTAEA